MSRDLLRPAGAQALGVASDAAGNAMRCATRPCATIEAGSNLEGGGEHLQLPNALDREDAIGLRKWQ
jgi:hypothetical protein